MYKAAPPFGVHSDRLAAIKDLEVGFRGSGEASCHVSSTKPNPTASHGQ